MLENDYDDDTFDNRSSVAVSIVHQGQEIGSEVYIMMSASEMGLTKSSRGGGKAVVVILFLAIFMCAGAAAMVGFIVFFKLRHRKAKPVKEVNQMGEEKRGNDLPKDPNNETGRKLK